MIDMLCVTMCMQVQFYHEKLHSLDVKVDSGLSPSTLTHRCVFVCVCVCGGGVALFPGDDVLQNAECSMLDHVKCYCTIYSMVK